MRLLTHRLLLTFTIVLASTSSQAQSLFESTSNTRDLGGYLTTDGRVIRNGMLYRSDALSSLTRRDEQRFQTLGIRAITDLRTAQERNAAPNKVPESLKTLLPAINPPRDIDELRRQVFSGNLSGDLLTDLLSRENYIRDPGLRDEWATWIQQVNSDNVPHLFHCTAGKDRTGFAAAILLLALGVPERRVMQDFLLSNDYIAAEIAHSLSAIAERNPRADLENLRKILGVDAVSLTSALQAMKKEFGSVQSYLEKGLALSNEDLEQLRSLILADPRTEGRQLTGEEISSVFDDVDENSQVTDSAGTNARNTWRSDGTMTSRWKNGEASGIVQAKWFVEKDQRCVLLNGESSKRCTPIYEFENQYFSTNSDGSIHGAHSLAIGSAATPVEN